MYNYLFGHINKSAVNKRQCRYTRTGALYPVKDYGAVYIAWMCTAPHNNKLIVETSKYLGVGGHLFAIAAQRSAEAGFGGAMTGFAANKELV